ncbi:hypothetical protein BN433_0042 [Erwinia amylovora Ea266]|nr:hypothetical protein BN433_0042 [Erwinia amylovora Ea266]
MSSNCTTAFNFVIPANVVSQLWHEGRRVFVAVELSAHLRMGFFHRGFIVQQDDFN